MGLDSIELLMEWERYFDIEIPNVVAEKIATVQNAVDAISTILNVSDDNEELKERIFSRLQNAIFSVELINFPFGQSDLVAKIIPENKKQNWEIIATVKLPHFG